MADLKSIAAAALGLLASLAAVAWGLEGAAYGQGVLASGVAVLVNFALWVVAGKLMFRAVLAGRSGAAPAFLIATKLVGLGFVMWGLQNLFPVVAVLLGSSVVVFSILLHSALLAARELAVASEA
ncbi:MAG: hypothetical protein H6742_17810 [Alphaproteobacteria bacterium]|nr:hypothetical protein [Alphaproteobacteria bacterium]